ncbi:MAG TPA: alpha/beta hydrolase [Devosia sp.]|jgi:acetyl esterase/lipase|nr:alpha/beta hydrolase [Devosia sp.]
MLRLALAALVGLLLAAPAQAQIDIMAPFNQPGSMDQGRVLAKDLAYADGDRKRLDIYAPTELMEQAPVVMFIYGGAWKQGRRADYQFVGMALAARGFVVVIPDYRLYPEVTYPDFLSDNAQAVKWIEDNIESYGGDTSRFFLAGHSAGAYNSVMLGLERSFLNEYGVTMPIKGIAALSGPYDFYPFEYDDVRVVFGQNDNPQGTQPINLVAPDRPPMLVASGTVDPIVRVQNTQNFAKKMREAGDWVTEKYYDGLGHMEPVFAIGAMWRWRAPVLDDMVTFFTQFGAFPSGAPKLPYTPEAPQGTTDIQQTIAELDAILSPIEGPRSGAIP